jgi:hypothetical protein
MDLISSFLGKFSRLAPPQSVYKTALCAAVKTLLAIEISPDRIRVDRGVAHLDINPLLKGELQLKKVELLLLANEDLKRFSRTIKDIR